MAELKEIKQTENKGTAVGVLCEKEWENVDDTTKDGFPCKTLRGKITIATDNGDMTFRFYQKSVFNGEHKANFRYDNLLKQLGEFVSKEEALKKGIEADVVSVNYTTRINDYFNDKANRVVTQLNYDVDTISRHSMSDEDEMVIEGILGGILTSKTPEIINENETGRLNIEIVAIGYEQTAMPYKLVVDEDLASDFDNLYEVGNVGNFDYSIVTRHIGAKAVASGGGLGRQAKVASGFDKIEWKLIGCSEPFEEEMEDWFNMEDVKPLLENRKIELEKIEKEGGKKPTSNEGLKNNKPQTAIPDDDLPF